jgi:hypothetical protein
LSEGETVADTETTDRTDEETPQGAEPRRAEGAETEYVEVYVPPEDMQSTARKLLDAAGEERTEIEKVETVMGGFRVPKSIADKAGISTEDDDTVDPSSTGSQRARTLSGQRVSADDLIREEVERGSATPEAVGAVFRQNAPDGEDASLDAARDEGAAVGGDGEQAGEQAAGRTDTTELPAQQQGQPRHAQETPAEELHGEDLDNALEQAGLPKTGRVAEKQQRLADYRAQQGGTTS